MDNFFCEDFQFINHADKFFFIYKYKRDTLGRIEKFSIFPKFPLMLISNQVSYIPDIWHHVVTMTFIQKKHQIHFTGFKFISILDQFISSINR
jgi:hypothetical protein